MRKITKVLFTGLALTLLNFSFLWAQQTNPSCDEREEFQLLDFWVGSWDVYSGDQKVGTNKIEKTLDGCAIIENWTSSSGGEGKSFFYYYPREEKWKQVWVTENPFRDGGVKEKSHIETLKNGGTVFQGVVVANSGTIYLDQTTLNPLPNGDVEQIIEISNDDGETWKEVFKAVYKPAEE